MTGVQTCALPIFGRLGLIVHATAGFCDPGWKGTLTLELNNLTRVPIKLYPGLEIAQLSFMTLDRPAERPYGSPELGSHYQGQRAATESRYRSGPHRSLAEDLPTRCGASTSALRVAHPVALGARSGSGTTGGSELDVARGRGRPGRPDHA